MKVINGISLTTYNDDPNLYNSVLSESIAQCMDGIVASDISQLRASNANPTSRRRILIEVTATSGTAIGISYLVTDDTPGASYNTLSSQLEAAVSTGNFNTYLNANAAASGATALEGCSSSSVTTTLVNANNDDSNSSSLSTGAIVGIVIGGVVFLGLIVGLIVYFTMGKRSSANPVGGETIAVANPIAGKA